MKRFFAVCLLGILTCPYLAHAATVDLGLSASSIRFSKEKLYTGETVRIYASIHNYGDSDAEGQVFFYQGAVLLGGSQVVSVLANGASDDVFVDFTVPSGAFNIRAVIQGTTPADSNPDNDSAQTPLYVPIPDQDQDGILDSVDNCVDVANADQANHDNDSMGDACDPDDDNDDILDQDEASYGTSPILYDTDGDGVNDRSDVYPTDPSRSTKAAPVVEPVPQPAPVLTPVKQETPLPAHEVAGVTDPPAQAEQHVAETTDAQAVSEVAAESSETEQALVFANAEKTSPMAKFSYRSVDWRTYEFTVMSPADEGVTYGWDFGDGATSVQKRIVHAFPRAGKYTVTLGMVDQAGNIVSDAEVLDISFFHLDNPLIQLTLGLLLVILLGLIIFLIRLRRRKV